MAYPIELRQRVVEKEAKGLAQAKIAEELSVSVGWVNKILRCYAAYGEFFPPRKKTGPRPKLTEKDREALVKWITEDPDQTLDTLTQRMAAYIGETISLASISKTLKAMGYSRKKNGFAKRT